MRRIASVALALCVVCLFGQTKTIRSGKFQITSPGSEDFHSYIESAGPKQ